MAQLVRHAYAHALDLTFVVAAGFGAVAGIAVFMFVRLSTAPAPDGGSDQRRTVSDREERAVSSKRS